MLARSPITAIDKGEATVTARATAASLVCIALLTGSSAIASARDGSPITCRKLSAVDGDTIKCDGINMRDMGDGAPFVSGYDTPEIRKAKCHAEKALGQLARKRMAELLKTPGIKIYYSGQQERRHKRPLVWIILPHGRSVGSVLISEGLARVWTPEYRPAWCTLPS